MSAVDLLFLSPTPLRKQIKLARVYKEWSQAETAVYATVEARSRGVGFKFKIQPNDISWLEKGGRVDARRQSCILAVLGIEDVP